MSNFDTAVLTVLKHEGGYVNDPSDSGGATNYGVSLRWLKSIGDLNNDGYLDGDIDLDGDVDSDDVKKLTKENATSLYKGYWWDKYGYGKIKAQLIATKLLTLSINMGSKQAHKCLQRSIRSAIGKNLLEDGIVGNITVDAVNSCVPEVLIASYKSEAAGFYRSLNKPKYIKGWLNRAYD